MSFRTPWRAVTAMFVLNGALYGIWASRIPSIAQTHDLSAGKLGLLLLLLAGGAVVAFPLAGRAADRFGASFVTLRLALIYTVTLILIGLAPSVGLLALALFAFGAAHGAMDVTMNAWAAEVERHMARPVMSSFHAMFSLGAGLGAGSGFVAGHLHFSVPLHFSVAALTIAALMLALGWIPWRSPRRAAQTSDPVFAFPRGALIAVGLVAFCTSLGEGAMADWSAIYLVEMTRVDEARAALGYTVFSITMVIMRLLGDHVTRRIGPVAAARFAGIVSLCGTLIVVGWPSFGWVLFGFVLLGIGYAMVMPLAFSRAANDPDLAPGAAIASVATLGYGGLLLGPPVIGFIADLVSLRAGFGLLAVLSLCLIVMARAVRAPAQ